MNLVERMALDATHAVYVMSNPDGTDCEFLLLNGTDSETEREDLRARWGGRNLRGVGVAFLEHGIWRSTSPYASRFICRLVSPA